MRRCRRALPRHDPAHVHRAPVDRAVRTRDPANMSSAAYASTSRLGALRAHGSSRRDDAPLRLRRGGPAPSPGDLRRRRGHGARHRRRAADQGRPRGLSALGMQAQGTVEVRARPPSIRDPRRGLGLFRPPREAFSPGSPVASFRNFATSRPCFLVRESDADKNCPALFSARESGCVRAEGAAFERRALVTHGCERVSDPKPSLHARRHDFVGSAPSTRSSGST